MPEITGFRALTYDPSRLELSQVVTPPYDVIDAAQRARLVDRHPHNFVQIDLPDPQGGADRYRAAADALARWQRDGIVRRDPREAVYRYHQVFTDPEHGRAVTRRGLVVAAALSPWSQGAIRPHEITFAAPREDRARLLDATRVHLSPVFAMYDDAGGEVEQLLGAPGAAPDLAATTDDGTRHEVWRIDAPELLAGLSQRLRDRTAYMLDGHHRYETMVAFRDRELARGGAQPAGGHGLMFLVPVTDPGLIVLPTHRVVCGVRDLDRPRFLADVQRHCRVEPVPGAARDPARLRDALRQAPDAPAFAAVFPDAPDAYLLSFLERRSDAESEISLLHEVVLERMLGIAPHAREAHLRYVSSTQATLDRIARGDGQLALVVRPPRLAQIKQFADAGRVMPQKSTYFFPKLASGLVMLPVDG
jgi:uncharacterized protein (DUF1015 family)